MATEHRFTRPYKLHGDAIVFMHLRIPAELKVQFARHCRERRIGASEVVRELIELVLSGKYNPPALRRKPRRSGKRTRRDG